LDVRIRRIELRRFLVLMSIFLLILIPNVWADSYVVGAWGDDASKGNMGVSVEIQTNIYPVNTGEYQSFWVGDNLDNGAFIQFGFQEVPGLNAFWFWQYWPRPAPVGAVC
jgi:hypothetical protein